jgi:hypothetical protein
MSTTYSFISSDPNSFSTLSFDVNLTGTGTTKYWVSDINFQGFLLTTTDDYIEFENHRRQKYYFPNKSDYDEDSLVEFLNELINDRTDVSPEAESRTEVIVGKTSDGLITFSDPSAEPHNGIAIHGATHRVRLLLGLVNYFDDEEFHKVLTATETPNCSLGNLMYLHSFEAGDSVLCKNENGFIIGSSIIYTINQFMRPNLPVIVKNKHPIKKYVNSLSHLSFQLTDKYNIPVVLRSPLLVSIVLEIG